MTPQEAIKHITECGLNIEQPLHDAVLECTVNALEKQIPKTPTLSWTGNEYETQCPVCHGVIDEGLYLEYRQYCSRCGQALDWSNVE